jgi:translocation protein SEC62
MPMPGPGQMPTPQQIAEMQRKLAADAQKAGMTVPQFIEFIKKKQAEAQAQAQKQAQQGHNHDHDHDHHGHNHNHNHNHQQGEQPQPIQPGPPKPEALAIANFLRGQNLKPRTCILNGQRKDMFKGTSSPDLKLLLYHILKAPSQ